MSDGMNRLHYAAKNAGVPPDGLPFSGARGEHKGQVETPKSHFIS